MYFRDPFQTLRRKFTELQKRVESLPTLSLEGLLGKVRILSACPIAEFSRFEAMELIEAIEDAAQDSKHDRANYQRLACRTLCSKLHSSSDGQFHDYLLPLLGDKDQEKVLEIEAKVDKHTRGCQERNFTRPPHRDATLAPYKSFHCYYHQRFGHTRATCFKRKRDLAESSPRNANNKQGNDK